MSKENTKVTDVTDKIDAAIKAAEARKAAKAAGGATEKVAAKPSKPAKGDKAEKPAKALKADEAERAAKKAQIEKDREERKAKKELERAAKAAEKLAARKPAHMSKVEKAAEKLPVLAETAQVLFGDATANLSRDQITALALHLQHFNRVKATERALNTKIEAGMTVRIVGGDPRYVGMVGTIEKAQRIRCYVEVDGLAKSVYCFTSDVELCEEETETVDEDVEREAIQEESQESTGTEG